MTKLMSFDSSGSAQTIQDDCAVVTDSRKLSKDETCITTASILRVLHGVAVATKAPDQYVQTLVLWLQQHEPFYGINEASSTSASQYAPDISTRALPIDEWRAHTTASPEINKEGIRQLVDITLAVALLREKSRRGLRITPETLDTIWALIQTAIVSAAGTNLHFTASRSAQGFLAVTLCSLIRDGGIDELYRVHVWLPDGERGTPDVAIHSHQPFAQSWILAGSGLNRTFDVRSTEDDALATHATYALSFTDTQRTGTEYKTHQVSSTVTNTGKLVRLTPRGSETHGRNMSYTVPSGAYHQSVIPAHAFHATLFFFDAARGFVPDAGVAGPKAGRSYTQLRNPGGITAQDLVKKADVVRRREQMAERRV